MKLKYLFGLTIALSATFPGNAYADSITRYLDNWNVRESENFILLSIIILLSLSLGVVQTTTNLSREARESGCSQRSILIQFIASFLAVSLIISGVIFFLNLEQFRGTPGILLTFGGSAGIFGSAYGFLLFGNYLYENPDKLK